ncbi:MAG: ATP--guanido phosphotransferase [Planctomycetota bacterium]|nr:MAG: ATP--guanido phosphotransferase [Planctomycetota bacterium]
MSYTPIDTRALAARVGSWLSPDGPDSDVVISCRVRLARNLEGYNFISRLTPDSAREVCEQLKQNLVEARIDGETWWVPMSEAGPVLRMLLRERNLISRDLAPMNGGKEGAPGRAVAFGESETVSVMVNEEDHLRLQAMAAGFDLGLAWQRAQVLDRYLETRVRFVYTDKLGYLTGCPTNVGTGLRASVMLHLPALGLVRTELEKVFTAAQRTGLAVRGMHGEGSRAAGDFYQISNQITLGRTEGQLIDDLQALVPVIVDFERNLRQALVEEQRAALQDRISHSYGVLRTARAMPTEPALAHLSNVRLGIHLGLFQETTIEVLNELGIQVQKAHIHALTKGDDQDELLDVTERDKLRAGLLRSRLSRG